MTHSHFTALLRRWLTGLLVAGLASASFAALLIAPSRLVAAAPAAAPTAVIVVTSNADDVIVNGDCTLREAIQAADTDAAVDACAAGSGSDTITFAGDFTITLGSTLNIAQTAILDGSGHTVIVDGNNHLYRVLSASSPITLTHLTIQNGGGVYAGGGVSAASDATLDTVVFLNNKATNQAGGLYVNGTATITHSTFISNQVTVYDPGSVMGGAVRLGGPATVNNSAFINNTSATYGGAIGSEMLAPHYPIVIDGSTFSGNTAESGGAITTWDPLTVTNSTFNNNTAGTGGAVLAWDPLTVTNSTFAENTATNALTSGGALALPNTTNLYNVTISGSTGSGIQGAGPVNLYNTLIANSLTGSDCAATVAVNLYNLIEDGTCAPSVLGDPLLGLLADNGGGTSTIALLPGSPAIDAGNNANCPNTDQRGITRSQNGPCDLGAFESRGFTLSKSDGDNQMTPRSAPFTAPLIVAINSVFGEPVNGGQLTYLGPVSGPGLASMTYTLGIVNGAASASLTANAVGGAYTVTASTRGAWSTVTYNLINNSAPNLNPIADQTTREDVARNPVQVGLSDADSPIGDLMLAALSGNPALIPTGNIGFGWNGLNRTLSLTPLPNQFGSATITFTVSDAFTSTHRVFNFNVTPVNDAPTFVDLSASSVAENQPAGTPIGTLSAADVDLNDTHTFSLVVGSGDVDNASFQITTDTLKTKAMFDYETRSAYFIRLRATDNGGLSVEQPVTITIINANDAPLAQPDYATTTAGQSVSVVVLANDSDPESSPLQVTSVGTPVSGTTALSGTSVLYTSLPAWVGTTTFTYTVSDGQGGSASTLVTVLINPSTSPQVSLAPDVVTTTEDTLLGISPLVNDSAPQPLQLIYVGPSSGGTAIIQGTQAYFTPALNFHGVTTFTYGALAGTLGGGDAIVTVNVLPVNDPPIAASDSALTPAATPIAIDVLANDLDVEANPLTVVSVGQSQHGLVQLAGGGVVTYTPLAEYHGPDQFAYYLSDGQGGTAVGLVEVDVLEVNRPPVATTDNVFTDEDTGVIIKVTANDTDPNTADSLQVIAVTQAQSGTVTLLPSGSVRYVPDADYYGPDHFGYIVADSGGLTATASVNLTVYPVLDLPLPNPVVVATSLDQPANINVLSETVNADDQPLSITGYTQSPNGSVTLNPDGTFLFTPTVGFEGLTEFTYTLGVSGTGFSAARIGYAPSADRTARVTIAVGTVTNTATIADDAVELTAGSRIEIAPLANVQCLSSAAPVRAPSSLANLVLIGLQRRIGLAAANPNGTVTFSPPPGFSGTDVITYTVSDGAGCFGTGVIELTVAPALRPPGAVDDVVTGLEDTLLLIDVTANDSDLGGSPITVTAVSQPLHGQVSLNADGTLSYVPSLNFADVDRLAYTLVNSQGIEGTAAVYVEVANVNDPPIARDDIAVVQEDTPTVIAVRANDTDPDGDPLSVTAEQPSHGSVDVTPLETLLYHAAPNFNGTDVLTYTVDDNHGGVATATLTINVTPVNDPPVAITDTATITGGQMVQINVLANDSDVDSAQLLVTGVSAASGTAAIEGNSVWYTPALGAARTDTLTYVVADEQGGQAVGTIVVTVLEVPQTTVTEHHIYLPLVRR